MSFECDQAKLCSELGCEELQKLVDELEQCHEMNVQHARFCESPEDRECALCLGFLGPKEELIQSRDPQCGRFHIFHRTCFAQWNKDCPVCRGPMVDVQHAFVDTPFTCLSSVSPESGIMRSTCVRT